MEPANGEPARQLLVDAGGLTGEFGDDGERFASASAGTDGDSLWRGGLATGATWLASRSAAAPVRFAAR